MRIHETTILGEFSSALGKGLLAGLAGTAAITISQLIEMQLTKRKPSEAPVKVASQVMNIKPATPDDKDQLAQQIHWAYGTSWGIARGLIALTGLRGLPAALVHFTAIWGTAMIMLPAYKVSPPVTEEEPETIAIDGLHHAVYALATSLTYDALDRGRHERKLNTIIEHMNLSGLFKKIRF